jgi:hypothetical protein
MNGPHVLSCLALFLALAASAGDQIWPARREPATPAAVVSASIPVFERFYVSGWVCPPTDSTNPARIAELADAGLNLMLPGLADQGRREDNLRRLDLAAEHGIKCIVWDNRFERIDPFDPSTYGTLDSVVADYRSHPAFLAYYLVDEPRPPYDALGRYQELVRERDPEHSIFDNLLGRAGHYTHDQWIGETQQYVYLVKPMVVCNDHYEFRVVGDRHQFVENASGLAAIARAAGLPFWSFIQLARHGDYRDIGPGELKWQASILLAFGAHGIGYFTYWTPPPDSTIGWGPAVIDYEGRRTHWFPVVQSFDRLLRSAGDTIVGLQWLATVHAGSLPPGGIWFAPNETVETVEGRATLGYFADTTGVPYVLVANSDSLSARDVTLKLGRATRACVLDEAHDGWDSAICTPLPADRRLTLALEAGSFALVRLEGDAVGSVTGGALVLDVAPTPARGRVRLAIARAGRDARVEIVDAGGRRAWSRRVPPGQSAFEWSGERDSGGRAPAGLYFARVEDARGVAARRIVWLGAR